MNNDPLRVTEVVRFPKKQGTPGSVPGFRITTVHLFTTIDDDDTEGLIGIMGVSGWMPLVCADAARVASYLAHAQRIATATGKTVKISRYSVREDVQEIKPQVNPP